jgi:site-specific recombinase XerD
MAFPWILDENKYLKIEEVKKLRETCLKSTKSGLLDGNFVPVRNCFMIELGLFTGLRVKEMASMNCGDLLIENAQSSLVVRKGKGDKKRIVMLSGEFKKECLRFLKYKRKINQGTGENTPLLCSLLGKRLSRRALQKSFKKCLKMANLPEHYGIHSLRHTYGSHLYMTSNHNLRLVQQQLGHSSIKTTEVYASLIGDDVKEAIENIYK